MTIRFGREIEATVSGSALRSVCCEQCNHRYAYELKREGTGTEFAWFYLGRKEAQAGAEARAARSLRKQLQAAQDVVPCPQCGFVQEEMVEEARANSYEWMSIVAIIAGFLFIYALALSLNSGGFERRDQLILHTLAISTGLTAFGFAFLQSFLRRRYNPNNWPLILRLEIARARCHADVGKDDSFTTNFGADKNLSVHQDLLSATPNSGGQKISSVGLDDAESVSSAELSTAAFFFWKGVIAAFLGILLLAMNPGEWRSLAAFAFAGVLWFVAYKFTQRKT